MSLSSRMRHESSSHYFKSEGASHLHAPTCPQDTQKNEENCGKNIQNQPIWAAKSEAVININMKSFLNMRRFLSSSFEAAKHLMGCDKSKGRQLFSSVLQSGRKDVGKRHVCLRVSCCKVWNPRSARPDRQELTSTGHSQSTRQVQGALSSEKCPSFPGTHANLSLDSTTSKHIRNLEMLIFPLSGCWTGRPVRKNCRKRFRN